MTAEEVLIQFEPLVQGVARQFFLPGGEMDDLLQEGRLALWEAWRCYRAGCGTAFSYFTAMVVRRHLAEVVATARRAKHAPLTDRITPAGRDEGGEERSWEDLLAGEAPDPVAEVIAREGERRLAAAVQSVCSAREWAVLAGIAHGLSPADLAAELGCSVRCVENAVRRARRKCRASAALCALVLE